MGKVNYLILALICVAIVLFLACDKKRDKYVGAGCSLDDYRAAKNMVGMDVSGLSDSAAWARKVDTMTVVAEYRRISAQEAQAMLSKNAGAIVLDVRTLTEFRERRVAGAVLIPVNDLNIRTAATAIPDKNAQVFVYCRRGVRSKIAANALLSLGYTDVYDFGGIGEWKGKTERN